MFWKCWHGAEGGGEGEEEGTMGTEGKRRGLGLSVSGLTRHPWRKASRSAEELLYPAGFPARLHPIFYVQYTINVSTFDRPRQPLKFAVRLFKRLRPKTLQGRLDAIRTCCALSRCFSCFINLHHLEARTAGSFSTTYCSMRFFLIPGCICLQ